MFTQKSDLLVSYRHPSDVSGERFVQLLFDTLPGWAVDIQEYVAPEHEEIGNYLIEDK
jgi:hypothetical protein